MCFYEGSIVAEYSSTELIEFLLVYFDLWEHKIVGVFGHEMREVEGIEGSCALGSHWDFYK
jgi:hypothetical protein